MAFHPRGGISEPSKPSTTPAGNSPAAPPAAAVPRRHLPDKPHPGVCPAQRLFTATAERGPRRFCKTACHALTRGPWNNSPSLCAWDQSDTLARIRRPGRPPGSQPKGARQRGLLCVSAMREPPSWTVGPVLSMSHCGWAEPTGSYMLSC